MKKAKDTELKEWNLFKCLTCESQPEFTPKELKNHLERVHHITETTGTRKMTFHLDGTDFFQSDYEWKIGAVKLAQQVRCERDEMSKALWS